MLTELQWLELRPKRDQIEAALHALGVPLSGWTNEVPTFRLGYEPDWEQIEKIATTLQTKGTREWPPYIKQTVKVPEKEKVLKGGGKKKNGKSIKK